MISYFVFLKAMTRDIAVNLRRIWSLAVFEYRLSCKDMFLGRLWKLLSPFIQIGAYWLVFGIGLRNGAPVDGIPYVVWLTCGVTPWFMLNAGVSTVANSIYDKATMLTRSNIPTCLIPISRTLCVILEHCWTVALMLVIFLANGGQLTVNALNLIYYLICGAIFMASLGLITSVLVMLARDFQKLIQMVMRLIFFLSPIFWRPGNNMPIAFQIFDSCNPFGYIVRGFRNSLLYGQQFYEDRQSLLVFWSLVVGLYLLGAAFQIKVRKNILDYL